MDELSETTVLAIALSFIIGAAAFGGGATRDDLWARALSWNISPLETEIFSGDAIVVVVTVKNEGLEEVGLDFGAGGIEAFSMEIRDKKGETIQEGPTIKRWGFTISGKVCVSPGATVRKELILNRWLSKKLPPGDYELVCRVKCKRSEAEEVRCPLIVLKEDTQKLKKRLSNLAKKARRGAALDARVRAVEMLCFAETPLSIRYKVGMARDEAGIASFGPRPLAISGLLRVGNLEATRELVRLCEDPLLPTTLRDAAAVAIFKVREGKDPAILAATEQIVRKYGKPPKLGQAID